MQFKTILNFTEGDLKYLFCETEIRTRDDTKQGGKRMDTIKKHSNNVIENDTQTAISQRACVYVNSVRKQGVPACVRACVGGSQVVAS